MLHEVIRQAIGTYFQALSSLDANAWVATFAEDGETHEPAGSAPHRGHGQLGEFIRNLFQRFESLQFTVDNAFIVGLQAAVKWTAKGVTKNGKRFTTEGIDVFVLNETGKIQRVDAYWYPAVPDDQTD